METVKFLLSYNLFYCSAAIILLALSQICHYKNMVGVPGIFSALSFSLMLGLFLGLFVGEGLIVWPMIITLIPLLALTLIISDSLYEVAVLFVLSSLLVALSFCFRMNGGDSTSTLFLSVLIFIVSIFALTAISITVGSLSSLAIQGKREVGISVMYTISYLIIVLTGVLIY